MNLHGGARTCPASRELLVERVERNGWSIASAAEAAGVSTRTCRKWLRRFREEGTEGLRDRSSRPHRIPRQTSEKRVQCILTLRRSRMNARQIGKRLKMPYRTVSRILWRHGLSRAAALQPVEPVRRYTRKSPGELLHIDIKKLGRFSRPGHRMTGDRRGQANTRGVGWEYVHVCVDDASRLAYVEVLPNEKAVTSIGFLRRALAWYREQGIEVERVMTDNGPGYRSYEYRAVLAAEHIRHLYTRPYRPQTNGKAERFIQTLLREWAYHRPYPSSAHRRRALPAWIKHYNFKRAHGSLNGDPPISRIGNNLLANHI